VSTPQLTTAEAIVSSLMAHGVDTVFGIPGAHTYPLIDAIAREPSIRFVTARHEQGAAYMALGYAKSTGRVGVFTVVPGPGILNTTAAIATAISTNAPILGVTANVMSFNIGKGRGQLHELPDQLATLRSLTKYSERIPGPAAAPAMVTDAFRAMLTGRPGPATLEAAWDHLGARGPVDLDIDRSIPTAPAADPATIEAAADLIAEAENPLIIVGTGAQHAADEVRSLAELIQAPVTSHRSGKGVLDNRHPLGLRSADAWRYWPTVDVVIGIGSRLELLGFRWGGHPTDRRSVRIEIDAEELERTPSDVGVLADAAEGTTALLKALHGRVEARPDRGAEMASCRAEAEAAISEVKPYIDFLRAIRAALPEDGFFVDEVTQIGFTARFAFDTYLPRTYVSGGYQDNLGFGFHTALGVKVGNPDRATVAVTGDGGLMFGVQELATAVLHGVGLVTVVFDNGGYGNVRRDQATNFGGRVTGAELANPDFVALAAAFGATGIRVDEPFELQRAIEAAIAADVPTLIHVPIDPADEVSPWPHYMPAGRPADQLKD